MARSSIRRPTSSGKWGTQTLERGINILEAVSLGATRVAELAVMVSLNRSTTSRIVSFLANRRYLAAVSQHSYILGPKAFELGFRAKHQMTIPRMAREHVEMLAAHTGEVIHLGILDGNRALFLDKRPGRRKVEIRSRIGESHPLCSTALGKALLLDESAGSLRQFYCRESASGDGGRISESDWLKQMRQYSKRGYTFDWEEYEVGIRCVAAPIRDATGKIGGAISISSAVRYMNKTRMRALARDVQLTAKQVSQELGWNSRDLIHIRANGSRGS